MKIQALNYFRRASEQIPAIHVKELIDHGYEEEADNILSVIERFRNEKKFLLPDRGRILNDNLKGLADIIRLPYDKVVLEYEGLDTSQIDTITRGLVQPISLKTIVCAEQIDESTIMLNPQIYSFKSDKQYTRVVSEFWQSLPFRTYISKDLSNLSFDIKERISNDIEIGLIFIGNRIKDRICPDDFYKDLNKDFIFSALELIEALTCINVEHKQITPRKNSKRSRLSSLQFDEYRILTIKKSQKIENASVVSFDKRKPREHLRRGHIRKLSSNKNVWVNSTIVCPGSGFKISSDYDCTRS